MQTEAGMSVRRIACVLDEPASTVGRWIGRGADEGKQAGSRPCPVSGDPQIRAAVKALCDEPRNRTFGYRRIWALLRREKGLFVNKKTVLRIMREEGLTRPKICYKPKRPKRMPKVCATRPSQAWQIDMTSFHLSDLTPMFLVMVTDCFTREIVGWTLDRRCRASEWISAVRMALEERGLMSKEACGPLTLRSDNGAQPCSKAFVEYLGKTGIQGEYTGYNAPDDNAYVERVIRTVKEEEIWPTVYDTFSEAHLAIERYVQYYNTERIHSALDYQTPKEIAATYATLVAA
jgi:putative transposase